MNREEMQEYLRRNLLVAKAHGAHENAMAALRRVEKQKRPPKWLVLALQRIAIRAKPLPKDLARYRDQMKNGGDA